MTSITPKVIAILRTWVARRSTAAGQHWFDEQVAKLSSSPTEKDVYLALGYATRRLGKQDLDLSQEDLAIAQAVRPLDSERLERRPSVTRRFRLGELQRR